MPFLWLKCVLSRISRLLSRKYLVINSYEYILPENSMSAIPYKTCIMALFISLFNSETRKSLQYNFSTLNEYYNQPPFKMCFSD